MLEQPVYHNIRISPYWRRKVGVVVKRQAVVPYVLSSILRLTHGANSQRLYHVCLRGVSDL